MPLLAELKRRNVIRVAAAYVAVAWLLIQVVETLFPVFGLSDAAIRTVVIVLAIGFIPAVVVAWAFELTPEGLVRDAEVDRASPAVRARAKRLDRIVMVALALAVGYFAFDKFMLDPARDEALAEAAKEAGRAEAAQEKRDAGPPVVAVLPFSAVTATEDSEFFAAGVHDDLLTRLAQLPSMLVISRTSVLEFKGVQRNIREIGEALGADAILEGGVQSAGNRIRINAQLIDAKTDEHLWAETYDRELTTASIFDVQDDIARAIAEALQGTFTAAAVRSPIPTDNMAAYRAYHEALNVRDTLHGGHTAPEYRELLQKAIELDPDFTRPLALLIGSYALSAFGNGDPETIARSEALLADIREVAPGSADHLIAQTYYTYYVLRDYDLALEIAGKALEMAPSDAYLVAVTSWIKRRQGDFEGQREAMRLARQLEPTNPSWTSSIINNLAIMHRYDEAAAEIERATVRSDRIEWMRAILAMREHGDPQRLAADMEALAEEFESPSSLFDVWYYRVYARDFVGAREALAALPPPRERPGGPRMGLANDQVAEIFTAYFLDDEERLAELIAAAREDLAARGTTEELLGTLPIIAIATLEALEGDAAETERLIRSWYRKGGKDWPERILMRDVTCQILAVAGAAEAAVACLREGLEEPSLVFPFLETAWPFYDGIRNEPVFIELVEELKNS